MSGRPEESENDNIVYPYIFLEPRAGFEPATLRGTRDVPFRLRGGCSPVSRNIYQAEPPRHQANARQRFDLKLLP